MTNLRAQVLMPSVLGSRNFVLGYRNRLIIDRNFVLTSRPLVRSARGQKWYRFCFCQSLRFRPMPEQKRKTRSIDIGRRPRCLSIELTFSPWLRYPFKSNFTMRNQQKLALKRFILDVLPGWARRYSVEGACLKLWCHVFVTLFYIFKSSFFLISTIWFSDESSCCCWWLLWDDWSRKGHFAEDRLAVVFCWGK